MPGRFFLSPHLDEIAAHFAAAADGLDDAGPRTDAAPGEEAWTLTATAGARAIAPMRWGMIPMGRKNARGRPVMETIVNARSETVLDKSAFAETRRAILPVSGWYEWTGEKRRKTRWRIWAPAQPILAFAAIYDVWQAPGGREVASFATLTCEPNADVRDYHHRMPVILDEAAWPLWLGEEEGDLSTILVPWTEGRLQIEEAADVMAATGH
ncbi:MAG: SOS response-associated peptidase [Pseudomonadota bacterium]